MMARALAAAAVSIAALSACGNKPPETPMSNTADPLLASLEAACASVLAHPTDGQALTQALGAVDPSHDGTPVLKPTDAAFSLGRVSTGPDGDVRGVELTLADPSPTLAASLQAAWGAGRTLPMMPRGPQRQAWTRDLGPSHDHVCMVIASLRRSDASWTDGKVETVTLRPDPRL